MTGTLCLAILLGYLIGSIPFAVIIARAYKANIFELGSGNPGATNVLRNLGKLPGYICFLTDATKGIFAVMLPLMLFTQSGDAVVWMQIAGLFGAILGHSFSCFLRFRGGKGVATTIGGLLSISPIVMLVGVLVWLTIFYLSRYVSLASILMGISFPLTAFVFKAPLPVFWLALVLAVLIVGRHHANIKRLLNGTEHRFEKK